jgi:hypothetical protein
MRTARSQMRILYSTARTGFHQPECDKPIRQSSPHILKCGQNEAARELGSEASHARRASKKADTWDWTSGTRYCCQQSIRLLLLFGPICKSDAVTRVAHTRTYRSTWVLSKSLKCRGSNLFSRCCTFRSPLGTTILPSHTITAVTNLASCIPNSPIFIPRFSIRFFGFHRGSKGE